MASCFHKHLCIRNQPHKQTKPRDKEHPKGPSSKSEMKFLSISPPCITSPALVGRLFSPVASVFFVCDGVMVGAGQVRSCPCALLGELYFPHCFFFFFVGVGGWQAELGLSYAGLHWSKSPFSPLTTPWSLVSQTQLLRQTRFSCYQIHLKSQNYWEQRFAAMLSGSLINQACLSILFQKGDEFSGVQRKWPCTQFHVLNQGPRCLECRIAEQMAVSWACFWWRKDGDKTAYPLMLTALESLCQLFQRRRWGGRSLRAQ